MPVLLADIGGLFAIGFLLISFIGWVINLINAQNPPPAPNRGPQRPPPARDRKVQNEIEQFLQEAMGAKRRPPAEVPANEIEILEPAPQRRPPTPRPEVNRPVAPPMARPAPTSVANRPAISPPQTRNRAGGNVSARQVVMSPDLGSGVTGHLQSHMQQRVAQESERHLPHAVDQSVSKNLGEFTADDFDPRSLVKPSFRSRAKVVDPGRLIADLHKADGLRKAIILQEILSRPLALRKT